MPKNPAQITKEDLIKVIDHVVAYANREGVNIKGLILQNDTFGMEVIKHSYWPVKIIKETL